jgi:hypothetical protein
MFLYIKTRLSSSTICICVQMNFILFCRVNFTFTKVNSPLPFSLFHRKMKWIITVCKLSFPLCPKWTVQKKWRWFDYIWTPMRQPGARSAPRRHTLIYYGMKCELPEVKINYHEYWTEISNWSICTPRAILFISFMFVVLTKTVDIIDFLIIKTNFPF